MRENEDPALDVILQRAQTSVAAFFDVLRAELKRRLLARRDAGADLVTLLQEARQVLLEAVEPLTRLLADANLVGWIKGAAGVAQNIQESTALTVTPAAAPLPQLPYDTVPVGAGEWKWNGLKVWLPMVREAVQSLQEKRLVTRPEFDQMDQQAREKAFTVANLKTQESLGTVLDAITKATNEGTSYPEFKDAVDEALGASKLGPGHLENVFRTGTGQAYSDGLERLAAHPLVTNQFPYVQALEIGDARETTLCYEFTRSGIGGTSVFRRDDPVWQKYRPLRHWQCRCGQRLLSVEDAAKLGVHEPQMVPEPNFSPEARQLWEQWSRRAA